MNIIRKCLCIALLVGFIFGCAQKENDGFTKYEFKEDVDPNSIYSFYNIDFDKTGVQK